MQGYFLVMLELGHFQNQIGLLIEGYHDDSRGEGEYAHDCYMDQFSSWGPVLWV